MFSKRDRTNLIMCFILSMLATSYSLTFAAYYPLSKEVKIVFAVVLGVCLGVLMTREINDKPTTIERTELFAKDIACFAIFEISRLLLARVSNSDYTSIFAAGICLFAMTIFFLTDKTSESVPSINDTKYIE